MRDVPYYSQWESPELVTGIVTGAVDAADDPRWESSGAPSPAEYRFWSGRVCGMACLKMVLAHHGRGVHRTMDLAAEVTEYGGYIRREDGVDGLIYAPFARYVLDRFDLKAEITTDLDVPAIRDAVRAGDLVMASVHHTIRDPDAVPPRPGGHLVLVVDQLPGRLVLHNPSGHSGRSQAFAEITDGDFARFSARRGLVIKAPSTP